MENYDTRVLTVGDWLATIILMGIPVVNIILLFVWAFGGSTPASKANWAKATLIIMLISFILTTISIVMFGTAIFALIGQ